MFSPLQNGRDTHVRQVELYGPRTATGDMKSIIPHHTALMARSELQPRVLAAAGKKDMDDSMDDNDDLGEISFPSFGTIR